MDLVYPTRHGGSGPGLRGIDRAGAGHCGGRRAYGGLVVCQSVDI